MVTLLRFVEYVEPLLLETEESKMANRLTGGRQPKNKAVQGYLTEEEYKTLEECANDLETTLSGAVRKGIKILAGRLGVGDGKN